MYAGLAVALPGLMTVAAPLWQALAAMNLVLAHLYADLMNLYADRGNIICWRRRCAWRGIELEVRNVGLGEELDPTAIDLIFVGGGADGDQKLIAPDLRDVKGTALHAAAAAGIPILAVCGGYQLFGHYYRPAEGDDLPGIGLIDAYTRHPGSRVRRCIGNVVVEWNGITLVGFENHGGRTYLGPGCRPLGRVLTGYGNNAVDGTEGAATGPQDNVLGTYLHGSLLPKNPRFADYLLQMALRRKYGPRAALAPLDDTLEQRAHAVIVERYASSSRLR